MCCNGLIYSNHHVLVDLSASACRGEVHAQTELLANERPVAVWQARINVHAAPAYRLAVKPIRVVLIRSLAFDFQHRPWAAVADAARNHASVHGRGICMHRRKLAQEIAAVVQDTVALFRRGPIRLEDVQQLPCIVSSV